MIRWVFLFLLLANAISLFWFAQQTESVKKADLPVEQKVQQIRLISEMPEGSLRLRKSENNSAKNDVEGFWCASLQGLTNEQNAVALRASLLKHGIFAEIQETLDSSVVGYEAVFTVPDELEARLYLLDFMEKNGVLSGDLEPESGLQLSVGSYEAEAQARALVTELSLQGVMASVRPLSADVQRYDVAIQARTDRKLSNKIKALVENSYSEVKIEKKVCEGVARLGRTE